MSMFNKTPNTAEKTVTKNGKTVDESTTHFEPFRDLLQEDGFATVSATYSLGIDHNSEKVTFHVTARCDQNEEAINKAGERVFKKALELTNEAIEVLGWKTR